MLVILWYFRKFALIYICKRVLFFFSVSNSFRFVWCLLIWTQPVVLNLVFKLSTSSSHFGLTQTCPCYRRSRTYFLVIVCINLFSIHVLNLSIKFKYHIAIGIKTWLRIENVHIIFEFDSIFESVMHQTDAYCIVFCKSIYHSNRWNWKVTDVIIRKSWIAKKGNSKTLNFNHRFSMFWAFTPSLDQTPQLSNFDIITEHHDVFTTKCTKLIVISWKLTVITSIFDELKHYQFLLPICI